MQVRCVGNRREWDALVVGFEGHSVRQGFDWGEFKSHDGWMPTRLAAMEGTRCLAAMSVLMKRLPGLGGSVMYAPRGPLVGDHDSPRAIAALVDELGTLAERERAVFLRVSPGRGNDDRELGEMLAAGGFVRLPDDYTTWNTPRITMGLPLDGGEQAVVRRMRKTTRRGIEIAARRGVKIRDGGTQDDFEDLHRLISLNARRKKQPTRRGGFYRLLSRFVTAGGGRLSFAEVDGVRIAAQFSVRFGERVHCLFYGASPAHLHMEAARALDWDHISWALDSGCHEMDFGGSGTGFPPRETDPGYGVYQYKVGLGCQIRYLTGYYDLVFSARRYRIARLIERRLLPLAWRIRARL